MPLVLVHNDVVANPAHQWDDLEGVHYHYPSKYRRKIEIGEAFVYYRGVHRAGGKRGPAEYTGSGRIGEIWADADRANAWYCSIVDYERFGTPVVAKVNGKNREQIASNLWRDGVRALDAAVYDEILLEARKVAQPGETPVPPVADIIPKMIEAAELIVPPKLAPPKAGGGSRGGYRRSAKAKAVGDWAEATALAYLSEQLGEAVVCVHRAALGETPGWDIDYRDSADVLHRVEVKGTVAAAFSGVELTANELAAARTHGDGYWLCLVADCQTERPKVQLIQNPASRLEAGEWSAKPSVISVSFAPTAGGAV